MLAAAFANRYELDAITRIELVMRDAGGERGRSALQYVAKRIDGRLHSIARLVAPEHLRGVAILTIEQRDRNHDAFVFLPSLGRARRIAAAQRGDAFFGSDLSYGDFERRRVEEFDQLALETAQHGGEAIYRIGAAPRGEAPYSRVEFDVAQADSAILEIRYFAGGEPSAVRVIEAPRADMVERGGHVLPTQLIVDDRARGSSTQLLVTGLRVNPPIPDRLFTVSALEQQRKLPEPHD
ncbi:MAG TPA: outer membrane lipoprotein-sorting protein [Myxococcota bacterium]|nr:outer membrane lipoprotein-sorting protein [Myxococcota bacterium]